MNPLWTVGGTLLGVFVVLFVFMLAARAKKLDLNRKVTRIWFWVVMLAVGVLAGSVCSIALWDIRWLYWMVPGVPIGVFFFFLFMGTVNFAVSICHRR